MKRGLNFSEAFFLVLFTCKGLGVPLFGHVVSWFIVFAPFLLAVIFTGVEGMNSMKGWTDRIRFFLWRRMATKKAKDAGKAAAKSMNDFLKNSANPGQAYDTK
jgi:hypothetical protein